MKKDILICVPTCNRHTMVSEVLAYELEYYSEFNIDICYYDSGDDSKTQDIIRQYQEKGYKNLYYKRTAPNQCIDYKLIEILKEDKDLLNYKYIWLINDSISIKKEALSIIFSYLHEDYHLIRLPHSGAGSTKDYICTDINDWFQNCSLSMAHMASTIMNTKLLEMEIDWDSLCNKYVKNNDIYDKEHGYFFTVAFYLIQIAEILNFKGIFLGNRVKWRRDSPLKQEKSYWDDMVFRVWVKSYSDTILNLPDVYTGKEDVIRKSDNIMIGRFGSQSMIGYRIRKLYSVKTFFEYFHYWNLVTDLSLWDLFTIAIIPRAYLEKKYGKKFGFAGSWENNTDRIEKKICDFPVIIYGAGLYGERVTEKLIRDGFETKIYCVAVSNPEENVDTIQGIQVKGITELNDVKKEALVIVATLPDTAVKIKNLLAQSGFQKIEMLFGDAD